MVPKYSINELLASVASPLVALPGIAVLPLPRSAVAVRGFCSCVMVYSLSHLHRKSSIVPVAHAPWTRSRTVRVQALYALQFPTVEEICKVCINNLSEAG